jgi:glycosyltransferase involved in cell wall biosynthesis
MKVLWFSNTPSLASKVLRNEISKETGHWISSLEQEMKNVTGIEIGIAFHDENNELQIVRNGSVTYFFLPGKNKSRFLKAYKNWTADTDSEFLLPQYLDIINTFKPDIIHIFGFENSFIQVLSKYSDNTIVHIQGVLNVIDHFINGRYNEFELLKATSLRNLITGNFYAKSTARLKKMAIEESKAFRVCKYLFGRTEWDKRVSHALAPSAKYFHCHEIMRNEFYENSWHKKRSGKIILYTTLNDRPYKGPDQIFYIDEILTKYHPEINYHWRVAGLDESSICIKVMRKKGYKINERVEFIGKLSACEIVEEMKNSDLFVYTSFIENGCNAVQEAMLMGMPIITTSAGGLSSTIQNRENGLLVQPGDPYAISGAIINLIEDYEFAVKLGKNARIKALERHNKRKITENVILAYKEILKDN